MKKLEKGFTLIELMIVVAIIAILAAVAAPRFGDQLKKAKDAKGIQVVGNWRSAFTMYYADKTSYATIFDNLESYVDSKTQAKTFEAAGGTYSGSTSSQAVEVGTGANIGGKPMAVFAINTSGDAIDFTTTATDTKGTTWSAY